MNSVIMAGGTGTRLRPLTCNIPKPLATLCGRPVLEYILDLIDHHGYNKAVMTLMYLGNKIVKHFGDSDYKGLELSYSFEDTPLGTAGSVKQAAKGFDDDFLVISGDALCDFDLTSAMKFHKKNKAIATLIVKKVEDPREYGLVASGKDGRIAAFQEKPSLAHCTTDFANTGIYILSPKVLDYIPDGKQVDFACDVFPELLRRNEPIFAYEESGYWCDIGDFKSYISCQKDMLAGKVKCDIHAINKDGVYYKGKLPQGNFAIKAPAYIGEGVTVGTNTKIEAGSVLGDNVTVGSDCKLRDCIVYDGTYISSNVSCVGSIIGKNAKLLKNSGVYECGVIGADATISEDSVVPENIKVWNNKTVPCGVELSENLQYGNTTDVLCADEGICGETNVNITPQLCVRIGASMASLSPKSVIGVGNSGSAGAKALSMAIISGILSAGGEAWDIGSCFESQFNYCMAKSGAGFGVFVESGATTSIKTVNAGGLPILRSLERKLEGAINRGEYNKARPEEFGSMSNLTPLKKMYEVELLKSANVSLEGISVQVKTSNPKIKELMNSVLSRLGCSIGNGLYLHISSDGRTAAVYSDISGYLYSEKILALLCLEKFTKGEDVAVPYASPAVIDTLAAKHGQSAHRYYDCPCDDSDRAARQLALEQPFVRDGLIMIIKLLSFLKENEYTIDDALGLVPDFSTVAREIKVNRNPSSIMKGLSGDRQKIGEGLKLKTDGGEILIRPAKLGKSIMIISESYKAETAGEICDFFSNEIKTLDNK
ncbi:MAG: sugar phosphate nucleotidyltransferase [Oscillospiraceae bacterium]|nr:sugar phosphate nucleotidyltransferase [Oscillospiraceae bacterium]